MQTSAIKTSLIVLVAFAACTTAGDGKPRQIDQPLSELSTAGSTVHRERDANLGERAYERAVWALEHANHVHYEHNNKAPLDQVVEKLNGDVAAETDCSGFASWVLYEVSPDRLFAVEALKPGRECPQAGTFARFFASLPVDKPLNGWVGLDNVLQLKKGDFIAWDAGKGKHGNTGHVAIVARQPQAPQTVEIDGKPTQIIELHVIDSSSVCHFPPEKLPPVADQNRRDGLGEGVIRLILNEEGKPVAHWEGTYSGEARQDISQPTPSPIISFGRLVGGQHFSTKVKSKDLGYDDIYKKNPWF